MTEVSASSAHTTESGCVIVAGGMERWGEGEWGGGGRGGDRMQLQCHLDIPVITYVTVATCQFSSVKLVSNSNSIQKTLLSVAIVTIKRIFSSLTPALPH